MKHFASFVLFAAHCLTSATAHTVPSSDQKQTHIGEPTTPELSLIELEPDVTRWVTDEDKWALKRKGTNFMDITETQDLGKSFRTGSSLAGGVIYPSKPEYNSTVRSLLPRLSKDNMRDHLTTFTAFHTRYYKSDWGRQSSEWLYIQVNQTIANSTAIKHGATVRSFKHPWGQNSVIAQIPGRTNRTIVIGAHQDSINLILPSIFAAPGADDDGSGSVTILEALRVLLESNVANGKAENTVEFHWYSAEEGGLLGSQAVFSEYKKSGREVLGFLHQDMTGYIGRTLDAGKKESMGVITDFVDAGLTTFIKELITEYCDIPYVLTKCGYACSDHASATKAGYPSAFVIESDFQYSDNKIHTTQDLMKYLSFDHMRQHAKLTLSFAYELAFASFDFDT